MGENTMAQLALRSPSLPRGLAFHTTPKPLLQGLGRGVLFSLLFATGCLMAYESARAQTKIGSNPTVVATDNHFQVESTSAVPFAIKKTTGNVGVGTLSPGNSLEVDSGQASTSGVRLSQIPSANSLATNASGDVVAVAAPKVCACGDIKTSLRTSDHGDWKLANSGGAFSCPSGGNYTLPDITGALLVAGGGSVGTLIGGFDKTIARNNLPNTAPTVTLTSTSAGIPAGSTTITNTTSTFQAGGVHTHTTNSTGANGGYGLVRRSNDGTNTTNGQPANWDGTAGEPGVVSAPIALTITSAGAHTHNLNAHSHVATFSGNLLASHGHTATAASINGGVAQQSLDVSPRSAGVNYFICVN